MVFGSNYNLDEMAMLDARMLESLFSFFKAGYTTSCSG